MFKLLAENLPDRPIFYDVRQQLRRGILTTTQSQKAVIWIFIVAILVPMGWMVFQAGPYISAPQMTLVLVPFIGILLPPMISPLLAGEYQKRSLEPLLAVPLAPRQLIMAKALRAVVPTLMIITACYALAVVVVISQAASQIHPTTDSRGALMIFPLTVLICLSWAAYLTASSLYVSACSKTPAVALLVSNGLNITLFLVVPGIIIPLISYANGPLGTYLGALHPFGAHMITVSPGSEYFRSDLKTALYVVGVCLMYFAISWGFLLMAARRLARYYKTGFDN